MMKTHYIFCYGTLRAGEANHYLLNKAQKVMEQCWTYGKLVDVGSFPALIQSPFGKVYGELYLIDEQQLQVLDDLEGYRGPGQNNHYERICQLVVGDRRSIEAWVYVYPNSKESQFPPVSWGDWKCHRHLENKSELYYLAYGSCMDQKRFNEAGKGHLFQEVVGCGVLPGYTFCYTRKADDGKGRADIVEGGGWVEGKVYRIQSEALPYLYRREGAKNGAYRPAFITAKVNGVNISDILTFLVVDKQPPIQPPVDYVKEIIRGAKGFVSDCYYQLLLEYHLSVFDMDIENLTEEVE